VCVCVCVCVLCVCVCVCVLSTLQCERTQAVCASVDDQRATLECGVGGFVTL
jgi:hypothetical protein